MNNFELEREETRNGVATYLRQLADGLEQGSKLTLVAGDESATINPPETVHLKIKTDTDGSWLGGENGRSFSLELGWQADEVDSNQELTIVTQSNTSHRVQGDDPL
ncbi:amphi-Trp domain-containing protein [Haloferax namakaokahaiae]|uniref:Amphi-Trp domain-containing protein n=1 Tax=Haloferax namakaokahaiae TaxID=1748331 RepID=A0ABD5ZC18_9EURY